MQALQHLYHMLTCAPPPISPASPPDLQWVGCAVMLLPKPASPRAPQVFTATDDDGGGDIDFTEFESIMRGRANSAASVISRCAFA